MGKHGKRDIRLLREQAIMKHPNQPTATAAKTAPQVPKQGTNSQNQFR